MTVEGTELGVVDSVTMDLEMGALQNLRLKSHRSGGGGYHRFSPASAESRGVLFPL